MNLILWIALGALAGYLACVVMDYPRKGLVWNILVGMIGAALGGFLAVMLGLGPIGGLNLYSLLIAVAGACLLLMILSWIRKRIG